MHTLLKNLIKETRHPLCVGFDPDVSDLHPFLSTQMSATPIESFLVRWYQSAITGISGSTHSIKFQSAFFEQFGAPGVDAMRDMILDAKRRGLYTILDAKRGDISTTMAAYGKSAFDRNQSDALTILPWMGTDSLAALIPWLKQGKGIYIVWLSSNVSGRDIQMMSTSDQRSVARSVFQRFYDFAQAENVTQQIGWVLGATDIPQEVIQDLPPGEHAFLLPGIGAQGAKFDHKTTTLTKNHPASLFPISRGILKPDKTDVIHSWDDYSAFVSKRWNGFIAAWNTAQN
ncbi:MAG: orotidine-5'-phosphate decarboxylase [Pseudomonadota bacterium]